VAPPAKIITETEYVTPPAPIVPTPDVLDLRDVEFVVVTADNIDEIFAEMKGDKVFFALTTDNYNKIALNLSDLRAYISQQKSIIILYENAFDE
jgi:hypothetical protein|tara:strand:- start:14160 stop:14441 length:282 start_codon:yes stop_codon:yes gene_type:complete